MQNLKLNNFLLVAGYWLLVSGFLNGCATVYNPATEKEELILIDTQSEVFLGRNIDAQVAQSYYVVKDFQINERVKTIGRKIALVSDRQDLIYYFKVVKDKEVNAFSTPGGYVYVNTGLLDKVDDDELAAVLGHEVGHIAARHIVKKLQAQMGYDLLMSIAFGSGGAKDFEKALNITFNIISLGYSREDEFLSDKLGLKYAYKAGYDPEAMIRFFKKLQELKKDKSLATPLFLRSHPYLEDRIKKAGEEIANLKQGIAANASPAPSPLTSLKPAITPQVSPSAVPKTIVSPQPTVKSSPVSNQKEPDSQTQPQFSRYGLYKGCPKCGLKYPRSYQYCPQDGTKLIY